MSHSIQECVDVQWIERSYDFEQMGVRPLGIVLAAKELKRRFAAAYLSPAFDMQEPGAFFQPA